MPFQLLDLILVGIMLISGVLALLRGFTREVLSVVAWGVAALAAYFAVQQPAALAFAQKYIQKEILAQIAVAASVFIIVLIIVSIISVKISDAVIDSAAGAVDRTLGFIFGLARGLVLVAVAYQFYAALTPPEKDSWVKDAQTLPLIQSTANILMAVLPQNVQERIKNLSRPVDENQPDDGSGQTNQQGITNGDSQSLGTLTQDSAAPQQPAQAPTQ